MNGDEADDSAPGAGAAYVFERIDAWHQQRHNKPLSHMGHGLVAVGMVCGSMALSSMGIIALILTGYSILALSFIVVFALPLFTRGAWLALKP